MNDMEKEAPESMTDAGLGSYLWQRKLWWLLPLVVFLLLLGVIYILGHLSSADSEMYPTTAQSSSIDCRSS